MQKRTFITTAAIASACLVASFVGCSSSNGTTNNGDSGTESGTESDSGAPGPETSTGGDSGTGGETSTGTDSGSTATDSGNSEAAPACTPAVPPSGTQLVKSASTTIMGMTTDKQVIYFDTSAMKLYAVAATAGSTPVEIGAWDGASELYTSQTAVIYWTSVTSASQTFGGVGTLNVWTAAGGNQVLSTASLVGAAIYGLPNFFDVSSDGSHILYATNANATASTFDVGEAATSGDAGAGTSLQTGLTYGATCTSYFAFVGATPVVASCGAAQDGGLANDGSITGYAAEGAVIKYAMSSAVPFFWTDKTGTQIAWTGTSGLQTQVANTPTNSPTVLDATATTVISATFTSDGTSILYTKNAATATGAGPGPLYRTTIATPSPELVAAGPFAEILFLSPDDSTILMTENVSQQTGNFDLFAVSTAVSDGGNTPVALNSSTTSNFYGSPFTADGTQALYYTSIGNGVGTYDHAPLPVTAAGAQIAAGVWESSATTAAKTLYNDNYAQLSQTAGYADIESVDLGTSAAATKLVSNADANFFVSTDGTVYAYSWNYCPGSMTGIWVANTP